MLQVRVWVVFQFYTVIVELLEQTRKTLIGVYNKIIMQRAGWKARTIYFVLSQIKKSSDFDV